MNKSLSLLFSLGCYAVANSLICNSVIAQVTPDGTTNTTVNPDGSNNFTIENGDRAGGNLFHSFDQFSVPNGGSAIFNNPVDITNILSRVTGDNISNIDGLIQANGSANLFLVNPAGILFGNNARLDIGGSFFGTTADSILFEDGEFSAVNNLSEPILTINAPIGLNFRDNPAEIINRAGSGLESGGLQVDTRGSLTLVGGNIRLEGGKLTAPGGSVELGGLLAAGTVGIGEDGSLSFPEEIAKANVSLTESALVNVVDAGGGSINVNAQNLELRNGSRLMAGIDEATNSLTAQAGDINLKVDEATTIDGPDSGIFNDVGIEIESDDDVTSSAVGNAGKINIDTGSLSITPGGRIGSTIFGQGNAGDVTINARENIEIQGFEDPGVDKKNPTGIFSNLEVGARGNSGTVRILSDSLTLTKRGQVRTSIAREAEGTGGDIIVDTGSLTLDDSGTRLTTVSGKKSKGTTGNIEINADTVSLNSGSTLASNLGQEAEGNAGNIKITANSLTLTTTTLKEDSRPGNKVVIETNVDNGAKGDAGNIEIQTDSLSLRGVSSLNSTLRREAEGNAGNILIETDSLSLDKDSLIRSTTQAKTNGNAGKIKIDANTVEIDDGATISSTTQGEGNAGSIEVNASDSVNISGASDLLLIRRIILNEDGEKESRSPVRAGGSSGLLSSVEKGASGKGGNITISTPNLRILDGAIVSAEVEAEGQGQGGNIFIDADTLEIGDGGQIIASSLGDGDAGQINLNIADSVKIFGSDPNFSERLQAKVITRDLNDIIPEEPLTEQEGRDKFSRVGIGDESQISGIFANSESQGSGGIVNIQAGSLTLEDEGQINATTNAGQGGNITLEIDDTLSMRNNALISAKASNEGSGGNVNIDADFIIAFPNQIDGNGSDIIASAIQGEGGRISINSQSLIGIQEGQAIEGNQTNDIDASSEFSLDGTVSINTPDINPIQGVTELPTNVVEPEQTVAQACAAGRDTSVANSLVVKGKGGIPAIPTAPIASGMIITDGELANNPTDSAIKSSHAIPTSQGDIIPARGIMKTEDGQIILTAVPVASSTSRIPNGSTNCGDV
ncbi:filamentous hemagglutinin N-terminal domain-containing protein [Pleurocapsa sp. PCC 7319]|uniref:two-partner secretion domain-containing protein n=1 Tax=Pleurocapsa sp. PCC 7319 TaxID=118161 RepID=UPI0003729E18|nr:filamentous hemagglutinin N-terminal domain-containing protein [Pleurocapsa sp. PCC 7319]